jgi:multicomponent Na+:H+ antiporter subunit A
LTLTPDIAIPLCVLLPFIGALLAPLLQRAAGSFSGWVLAVIPAAMVLLLWWMIPEIARGEALEAVIPWAPSMGIDLSFRLDGLSLTFALTIAAIGAFILVYSAGYLRGHPHQGRFFSFMMMFMGAMQGLVLADSLIVLYVFWELTTVTSFLLIGFDHSRQLARRAAIEALVVTGIGGLALLAGGVLIHALAGSWSLSEVGIDLRTTGAYPLLAMLMLLAAFTKSAQVPFHFWLPSAMEAPTPVSAYLHSAAMVQGGVYLAMRLTPLLGGEPIWNLPLLVLGGATLIWGAIVALRQTDLKQMLAQTTLASLGLLMLLIGVGTAGALTGAAVYFLAHALYKAGLFLVVGAIEHETGTRDVTALGGLREVMAMTFIGAILAAFSMFGLPPALGYLAKEEMYGAVATDWQAILPIAAMIAGNALLCAVALVVAVRPFLGPQVPTPTRPHEAPAGMLVGPVAFGLAALAAGVATVWIGDNLVGPMAAAATGQAVELHFGLSVDPFNPLFWLSILTWVLGIAAYWRLDAIRALLRRMQARVDWSLDRGFDLAYFGLVRLAGALTRALHHGRLEVYLIVVFVALALAALAPLWALGGLPAVPPVPRLRFYEWAVLALAAAGVVTVVVARTRLFAILALGVQGLGVAILYMLFGAPDLSFTQFMVEILSVVILALVMTRLRLDNVDPRPLEDLLRDGALALIAGVSLTLVLFAVIEGPFDPRLSRFFEANSAPVAHGHNVVNVIIVDFRGLDTLGEISVLMTAGIAIVALIRSARKAAPAPEPAAPDEAAAAKRPPPRRRRKAAA